MITAALALTVMLAAGPRVTVDVLSRQAPRGLVLRGGGAVRSIAARGDVLLVDGRPAAEVVLPPGRWRIDLPGGSPHVYEGLLVLRAVDGVVRVRGELALEPYVASVVASEALPGTPPAALEALAIVARSYALAARDRHADGALCDLAHCQLLGSGGLAPEHRAAAVRAARATMGEVLVLPSGEIAEAAFHAACGGHTAAPREVFGSARSGGGARPDPGCVGPEWSSELTPESVAAAIRSALSAAPRAAAAVRSEVRAGDVVLLPGAGGWLSRVEARDGSWRLSGDAFARALDAAAGRGRVRSGRFTVADVDGRVAIHGTGHGHGVGLCQAGAARWAGQGEDRRAILARYFPGATVVDRSRTGKRAATSRTGPRTSPTVRRDIPQLGGGH